MVACWYLSKRCIFSCHLYFFKCAECTSASKKKKKKKVWLFFYIASLHRVALTHLKRGHAKKRDCLATNCKKKMLCKEGFLWVCWYRITLSQGGWLTYIWEVYKHFLGWPVETQFAMKGVGAKFTDISSISLDLQLSSLPHIAGVLLPSLNYGSANGFFILAGQMEMSYQVLSVCW